MNDAKPLIVNTMLDNCQTKIKMTLPCLMIKDKVDDSEDLINTHFDSNATDASVVYDEMVEEIQLNLY